MSIFQNHFLQGIAMIVFVASILHSLLPPWDFLNDFPTAQKYYKLFVYVVGYVAVNARSTLYQSISTKDGTVPSAATQQAQTQAQVPKS